jgi:uncharacterized delta-60 repeat protein
MIRRDSPRTWPPLAVALGALVAAAPTGCGAHDAVVGIWDGPEPLAPESERESGRERGHDQDVVPARVDEPSYQKPDPADAKPAPVPVVVPAGFVDASFGRGGGAIVSDGGEGIGWEVAALAVDPAGSILVSGRDGGVLVRLRADGAIDSSFGSDGFATPGDVGSYMTTSLAVQPDGRVVLGGMHGVGDEKDPNVGQPNQAHFYRLNPDGTLDPSFGQGGFSVVTLPETAVGVGAVALQPDGKLLAAGWGSPMRADGSADSDASLLRLLADGTLDESFSAHAGFVLYDVSDDDDERTDEYGHKVLPGPDGVTYVVGYGYHPDFAGDYTADCDCLVLRFSPDGQLDPAFGQGGAVYIDARVPEGTPPARNFCPSAAVDAQGRLVVIGFSEGDGSYDAMFARLLPDGQFDPSFGEGGLVMDDLSRQGSYDRVTDVVTLPDGSIVAVGSTHSGEPNSSFYGAIVRLTAAGERDATFGDGGLLRVTLPGDELVGGEPDADGWGGSEVTLDRVALQADGKIVAGGHSGSNRYVHGVFVLRLDASVQGGADARR